MYDWGWGMWLGSSVLFIAFWALIIWAVATLARRDSPTAERPPKRTAAEVLGERLARGEIDTDEYRRRLDALGETVEVTR